MVSERATDSEWPDYCLLLGLSSTLCTPPHTSLVAIDAPESILMPSSFSVHFILSQSAVAYCPEKKIYAVKKIDFEPACEQTMSVCKSTLGTSNAENRHAGSLPRVVNVDAAIRQQETGTYFTWDTLVSMLLRMLQMTDG